MWENRQVSGSTNASHRTLQRDSAARDATGSPLRRACVAELRAVCAIIFGLYAVSLTFLTFSWVMSLFVVFLFVDGALAIFCGCMAVVQDKRGVASVLPGVPNIVLGVTLLLSPPISPAALVVLLAFWAAATGVLGIGVAWRETGQARFILLGIGGLCIAWAALICLGQTALAVPFAWWLGAYGLALGLMLLVLAPRLRADGASSI
jgi:uncharacterized membrane protein HdeD (DUF308 family)